MEMFIICGIVGFIAQMIDGTLGMAYGISCTSFLLSMGIPPALGIASVKSAEVFTTAASGISHWIHGNVDKKLFIKLVLPGVLGGFIGAYALSSLSNILIETLRPLVAFYLLIMGGVIIAKAFAKKNVSTEIVRNPVPLALWGGLLDAMGGGGWGPIVTSSLLASNKEPRMAIGSVNLAEFFVTLAQTITFLAFFGFQNKTIVLGLIAGGIIAAPFAAKLCKKIPTKTLMAVVGSLVIILSLRTILLALKLK